MNALHYQRNLLKYCLNICDIQIIFLYLYIEKPMITNLLNCFGWQDKKQQT